MAKGFDWDAIRAYYDVGHTRTECQERFGFSNGAWSRAVERGEIVPRQRSAGTRAGEKRERVAELRAAGKSYVEIARELGLKKSTVAYHARRAGLPADERFARRYDWAVVQQAVNEGLSVRECMQRFGFSSDAWSKAVKRGAVVPRDWMIPLSDLLVVGRGTNRRHLKRRLINAGLKEERCEKCGLVDWNEKPIALQLHHVNGDGDDNRLTNLQLLCPNCHAQTPNWGGRNRGRRRLRLVDVTDAA